MYIRIPIFPYAAAMGPLSYFLGVSPFATFDTFHMFKLGDYWLHCSWTLHRRICEWNVIFLKVRRQIMFIFLLVFPFASVPIFCARYPGLLNAVLFISASTTYVIYNAAPSPVSPVDLFPCVNNSQSRLSWSFGRFREVLDS